MKQRTKVDRRVKKIKVEETQRRVIRRKEDLDNAHAYNVVFYSISSLIIVFGVLSFIWGR